MYKLTENDPQGMELHRRALNSGFSIGEVSLFFRRYNSNIFTISNGFTESLIRQEFFSENRSKFARIGVLDELDTILRKFHEIGILVWDLTIHD